MMQPSDCRILLVDDEESIRLTLGLLLEKVGYHVDCAACHAEVVACLQTARYDLAFVDIMLAGESGLDVLRDIKAASPATKVIMFTGLPQVETAAAATRLGAFDYIMKPVRPDTLFLLARHALRIKEADDKLEKYRANMDTVLRAVPDAIVMIDSEGRLVHFNAAAEKICGYSGDHIGKNIAEVSLGFGGYFSEVLLNTISGNSPSEIRRVERAAPGAKNRVFSLTTTPLAEADGTVSGAVAVIRDETRLAELEQYRHNRGRFHGMVGASEPMQRIFSLIDALADVKTTVLISGENGTGKELVAAALHALGNRADKPFIKVNCSALSESLLESELFGHVRGAFTGAVADRVGRFQGADGGTLFLDEIGDISLTTQMRLLRVLQEQEFERVGETHPIKVDVRIIAATNQDLAEKIRQGTFRQDLYYRLNVVRMVVPALRERPDDLELLVAHFITKCNRNFGKDLCAVSDDVMAVFQAHSWPGNVRELEHAIEHAAILCRTDIITVHDLPQELLSSAPSATPPVAESPGSLPSPQKKITIEEALAAVNGNRSRAAELLGISRRTLYRHLGER
jgi:PAS domain S-box-containing protein